ncbi:hypothetical protein [Streptomyces angustmyceticus]|uniref:hypothetical protein n=1 Tax=Streptomyces angustmyceticus TaxID=285578 RepID=UPI00382664D6
MERPRPRRLGHRHQAPLQRPPPRLGHPPEGRRITTEPQRLPVPAPGPGEPAPAGTEFTDDVLAKLAELEERSAQHEIDLRPRNTVDGYAADWKQWTQFCALLDLPVTAITPGSLTAFVEWLWMQPG